MVKKRGVINNLVHNQGLLHKKIDKHPIFKEKLTLGQRASDKLTIYAGSWYFIFGFLGFLLLWILLNGYLWHIYIPGEPFDPRPFILLNLLLSCLAAIQAPVILMTQNRQAQRDRIDANYDHAVNRKAEREIQAIQKDLGDIKVLMVKKG